MNCRFPLYLVLLLLSCLTGAGETDFDALAAAHLEESLYHDPVQATFLGDNRFNDRFEAPISASNWAAREERARDWLRLAREMDPAQMTPGQRVAWQSFIHDREMEIRGYAFPRYYLPIDQFNGWHIDFPAYASGDSVQPFHTVQDYENFLSRAEGFVQWMRSAVPAMREGMARGYTQPRVIVEKVLPQLQAHIVDDPRESAFYAAIRKMPENFSDGDRARLEQAYRAMIRDHIVPAYREVHRFMAKEYLPRSRDTVGLDDLPDGEAWYAWEIARRTTLPLSAGEIHSTGRGEVQRILGEMEQVRETVGFDGSLAAFFEFIKTDDRFYFEDEKRLLALYRDTLADIATRMPQLFRAMPKAELQVRPIEPWRAASAAGASYQNATPDGSRPAIFYINTFNLRAQPWFLAQTLSLHEAMPGHYYQGALQIENQSLSPFQRYSAYTVYSEGWALYAESLGRELGLFQQPYYWYGRLSDEQLRALRLVVDTGLHAFGWSREQAIDYMLANSSMARSDITAEVERYIVWPGQALAYKIGDLHLQALRRELESAMGPHFDIRDFHEQVLKDGELPMPVLEAKLRRWAETRVPGGLRAALRGS